MNLTVGRGVVGLLLLAGLVYANALGGPFIWDDEYLYLDNPRILKETVKSAFTLDHFPLLKGKNRYYVYRPIGILAHSWMARTFGLRPFFLHLASLVAHAAAGVLVFLLVLEINQGSALAGLRQGSCPGCAEIRVAWVTAALFLVHPLHAEAVAWMAAFSEVLAGALFLLSLYTLLRSRRTGLLACSSEGQARMPVLLGISYLAAALAFLTKETALALPLVAALLVGWRAWPYFAIAGGTLLMRFFALGLAAVPSLGRSLGAHIRITAEAALHFAKKMIWPWPLALQYHLAHSPAAWVAFALGCALALWLAYRHPRVRLALLLLVLPLTPALALSSYLAPLHAAQDRNAYVAVLGLALLVGYGARWRRGTAAALAVLALWSGLTVAAIQPWQDQEALWKHTLRVTPNSKVAVIYLGYWYFTTRRFAEADRLYQQGLALRPNDPDYLASRAALRKLLESSR